MQSQLIRKDPDAGKDRRQEEKGMTEDQMVEWHHRLNGHEFEQSLGDGEGQGQALADGEGQGSLARCSPCGCHELDTTEQLKCAHTHTYPGGITLPTKVHLVKAMVFPVVTYECESWNIKKAEHQRIDAFELWCWRRLLRVPWRARRSNQSILKKINPEYSS